MNARTALFVASPLIAFGVYMYVDRLGLERTLVLMVALSAMLALYLRHRRQQRGEKELPLVAALAMALPILGWSAYVGILHPTGNEGVVAYVAAAVASLAMYYYFKHRQRDA